MKFSGVTEEPGNDYRELEGIKIYVGNREESAYFERSGRPGIADLP